MPGMAELHLLKSWGGEVRSFRSLVYALSFLPSLNPVIRYYFCSKWFCELAESSIVDVCVSSLMALGFFCPLTTLQWFACKAGRLSGTCPVEVEFCGLVLLWFI